MRSHLVAALQVLVAVVAGAGCVVSWLSARSVAVTAPVLAGEPAKTSLVYDPPLVGLALLLAAVAGVMLVFAGARLRRWP